jgi:hypothetical protein
MAKMTKLGTVLPPDTFFNTIPFEQPGLKLTSEMLAKHYPVPKGRRAHMGIHTEHKAFKNGIVWVEVKAPDNSENMLFLHIGLTELDVACTCGMPDGKLCYHAYMGLYSISFDFATFYWPGFTDDERMKDKFLITNVHKNWITLKPKTQYGNVFKPAIGFKDEQQLSINKPAKPTSTIVGGQEAIAYCLAYNLGHLSNLFLPVLIPCLGVTGKNNKEIISFKQFGRRDKPIGNISYTANQELLNDISYKLYDISKAYDNFRRERKRNELHQLKHDILVLWEKVIPLLLHEQYNYKDNIYWLRFLKDKPRKAEISDCRYSLERPVLSFILKFHQHHFSLAVVVSVNGTPLKFNYKPHLFVFDEMTELCYLMPSVQDDDVLMWMLSYNNRLTILKGHFKEFHNEFMEKLNSCYTVLFTDTQTKKSIPYDFDTVCDELVR